MKKIFSVLALAVLIGTFSMNDAMAGRCDGKYESAKDFWMDFKLCN